MATAGPAELPSIVLNGHRWLGIIRRWNGAGWSAVTGPTTAGLGDIGQVSGILFILAMDLFKNPATGSMTPALLALIGLMVVGALLSTRLRESKMITGA